MATATNDGSVFLGGGAACAAFLGSCLVLTPSFAPGWYGRGRGKDLGDSLEFRWQLELVWRFAGGSRPGASVSPTSNASLGDSNPGQESCAVVYEPPLARLTRHRWAARVRPAAVTPAAAGRVSPSRR